MIITGKNILCILLYIIYVTFRNRNKVIKMNNEIPPPQGKSLVSDNYKSKLRISPFILIFLKVSLITLKLKLMEQKSVFTTH